MQQVAQVVWVEVAVGHFPLLQGAGELVVAQNAQGAVGLLLLLLWLLLLLLLLLWLLLL